MGGAGLVCSRTPVDHPSGTFWNHPHLHRSVADQVFGGRYGAIISAEASTADAVMGREGYNEPGTRGQTCDR